MTVCLTWNGVKKKRFVLRSQNNLLCRNIYTNKCFKIYANTGLKCCIRLSACLSNVIFSSLPAVMIRWIVQPGSAELLITMVTDHTFGLLSPQDPQNGLMFMSTVEDESAAVIPLETWLWPHFFSLIITQYGYSFDSNVAQSRQQ